MKFKASAIGSGSGELRPVVGVRFGAMATPLLCLADSGALGIRVPAVFASPMGVSLTGGSPATAILGGHHFTGATVDMDLHIRNWHWRAPVTFLDGFNGTPLLGLAGFFDHFTVRIDMRRGEVHIYR